MTNDGRSRIGIDERERVNSHSLHSTYLTPRQSVTVTPSSLLLSSFCNMVQILKGPCALPTTTTTTLSIMSYNILLPNSQDGWWTYKMYNPPVVLDDDNPQIASWEYRRDLIQERIRLVGACAVRAFVACV